MSDQPPPTYTPPASSPNPLIPRGNQRLTNINPRIWVGAVIGILVIVVVLLLVSQPRGSDGVNPTQIALEQTSTQNAVIFITQTFSAITPTIDPKIVAIETQGAELAQGATDQAGTSQAILSRPTETLQPTDVAPDKIVTATPQPTQQPTVAPPTPQPTVAQPTQPIPTQPPSAIVQSGTVSCSDGRILTVPVNGQVFRATVNGMNGDNDYVVIYDPTQSGASDIPANGWWYQPCLSAHRVAHEVALIVNPGVYRFVGPECQVWQNIDGNHPFDQGNLLVSRENVQRLTIPATKENESWLFVRCRASDSSGFSFAKLP